MSLLSPAFRFLSDMGRIMIKDDQLDLAFPTRAHSGFAHHWKWGLFLHTSGSVLEHLTEILRVIQTEPYKPNDTPQTYLKRVIQIHQKTYNPAQEAEEQRLSTLLEYFNSLKDVDSKEKFKDQYEKFMHQKIPKDVIYGGKIKLKSQVQQSKAQHKRKEKTLDPPRVYPPSPTTSIRVYKPST